MGQSLCCTAVPVVHEAWRDAYTSLVTRLPSDAAVPVVSKYREVCASCAIGLNDTPCIAVDNHRVCCNCYARDRIKHLARYVTVCRELCRQLDTDIQEYLVAYVKQLVWRLDECWSGRVDFTLWRIVAYRLPRYWNDAFTIRRGHRMLCVDAHRWYTEYYSDDSGRWTRYPRDDQFRVTTVWLRLFTALDGIIRNGRFCPISGGTFWCGDPYCRHLHICATEYMENGGSV